MRQARQRRIGKWIKQEHNQCWLASVCIVTGYKYSRARQERYANSILKARKYSNMTDEVVGQNDCAIARLYRAHCERMREYFTSMGHHDAIPDDANGTISMFTQSYAHTVAVVDGVVYDPALHNAEAGTFENFKAYLRSERMRPSLIIYEEIRP